jgi:hypothetical protein
MINIPSRRAGRRFGRWLAFTFTIAVGMAACSSAGTAATHEATASPPAATAPGAPSGSDEPISSPPDAVVPGGGDALVVPKPGQLDVHPIAADSFAAQVDGRHVILTITYTSGVEPCSVLDTIIVERGQGSYAITLREGHGPGEQVCIMIAKVMRTQVDLGEIDPGTYTITDTMGGADPLQVVVN